MSARSIIERDLSRDLQQAIGEVLKRKTGTAQQVLNPSEVAVILVEAAVSTALSCASTIASVTVEAESQTALYDATSRHIVTMFTRDRERALREIAAATAHRERVA